MKIKFKQWNCILRKEKYQNNGRIALRLYDENDGDPIATATTNIPDIKLNDDEVLIKNYSENEGMLKTLIDAKIISDPIMFVEMGFVTLPVCKYIGKE